MSVTVHWLLAQHSLGLTLRTAAPAPDTEIGIVITTELIDPTPWLSGGEMVLTTGIRLPDTDTGLREYIHRLVARGVVALGFGAGISLPAAPPGLVAAADEAGLPVLEVPLPTPFVAVARAVIDQVAAVQYRSQVFAARAQPRMTRAAVSGGPLAVLRELAATCEGAAVLLDAHGRVTLSHPAGLSPAALRSITEQVAAMPAESAVALTPAGTVVTQSIGVAGRLHGYLAVVTAHEPKPTEHVLIGHANSLLTLDFEKPYRLHTAQSRVNAAALRVLISAGSDLSTARDLVAEAADDHGRIRALCIAGVDPRDTELARAVDARLLAAARATFVIDVDGGRRLVVLLRGEDGTEVAAALISGGIRPATRRSLRLGLSSPRPVAAVADAVAEATLTAAAAHPGGGVEDAATLAGRTLLTRPDGLATLRDLSHTLIDPLRDYDAEHDTELLRSLRMYLDAHGQWEPAAALLGVHRHTLRTRIARAAAVIGVDLGSARVRAELLLALIAAE